MSSFALLSNTLNSNIHCLTSLIVVFVKLCVHFCVSVYKSSRKWTQTDTKVTFHPPPTTTTTTHSRLIRSFALLSRQLSPHLELTLVCPRLSISSPAKSPHLEPHTLVRHR